MVAAQPAMWSEMKSALRNVSPLPFDNLLPVVFMHVMNIWRYGATAGCVRRRCEAVRPGEPTAAAAYSNEKRASVDEQTPRLLFPSRRRRRRRLGEKLLQRPEFACRPTRRSHTHAHAACLSPTLNSLIIHPRVNVLNALYSLRSLDQSINPTLAIQGHDLRGSTNERPV